MMKIQNENILSYSVSASGVDDIVNEISSWIQSGNGNGNGNGKGCWLACINPHSYVQSTRMAPFSRALHAASMIVPDGIGIVIASRLLNGNINNRVTGFDVFHGVSCSLNKGAGYRVFFLGSTEETLSKITERYSNDFPNIEIAGTFSPSFTHSFSDEENDAMIEAINLAEPDVLWVGMTAPKQELWLHSNMHRIPCVKFAAAIGAVFDFYTEQVKRGPLIYHKFGMEWLSRLIQQPRRLWKRTFISGPIFLLHLLYERLRMAVNQFDQ